MPQPSQTEPVRVEAIDRALQLLEALAPHGTAGLPLASLVEHTGANKATAYRALSTLRARGYVVQNPDGTYAIGPAVRTLAGNSRDHDALAHSLHPALTALSAATNELVHLGALTGDRIVYLDKVEPDRAIRVWSAIGRSLPAASTAMGRALLAAMDRPTSQTTVYLASAPGLDAARLHSALETARANGHAVEVEENEPGVACLGAAILQHEVPIAAISVTCLADHFTPARREEIARTMRRIIPPLLPSGMTLQQPITAP